jgi:hypothetical protein
MSHPGLTPSGVCLPESLSELALTGTFFTVRPGSSLASFLDLIGEIKGDLNSLV